MIDYLNDHVPEWALWALAVIALVYVGLVLFAYVATRREKRDSK
jgi:cbb3-type cytochrome oxidase subunit 3